MVEDMTRRGMMKAISWEMVIALVVNVALVTWFIAESQADQNLRIENVSTRVSAMEGGVVSREEFGRLDQKLQTVIDNQNELKQLTKELQRK